MLYGLSRVNNTTIEDIVDISSGDIASLVDEYNTDEVDKAIAEITKSVNSSGDTVGSETVDYPKINNPIESPFMYNAAANEKVELSSGSLVYETTDYVLPGVNGLDLVIGLRYNSQEANESSIKINSETYPTYIYRVTLMYFIFYRASDGSLSYLGHVEYEEIYDTAYAAQQRIDEWEKQYVFPYYDSSLGVTIEIKNFWGQYKEEYAGEGVRYSSDLISNDYLYKNWGLGYGWEFCFSSIETNADKQFLHLSTGEIYEIDFKSYNNSNLKDHELNDLVFEKDNGTYTNGYVRSSYKLTYSDGKIEYFSYDGKLICIQDRYGNTITFIHNNIYRRPHIKIIDTLGREVNIDHEIDNDGVNKMIVTLPNNISLTYITGSTFMDELSTYINAVGEETHYSYTVKTGRCNALDKDLYSKEIYIIQYYELTTITHPTNSQTLFEYQIANRNFSNSGLMEIFKLKSRRDLVGGSTYNDIRYN